MDITGLEGARKRYLYMEKMAEGHVNRRLKYHLWAVLYTRRRRRMMRYSGRGGPRGHRRGRGPYSHNTRRKAKTSVKLDFIGTVMLVAKRYPISVVIWRSCRMLLDEVFADGTFMAGQGDLVEHLLEIRGQINTNIEIRSGYRVGQTKRRQTQ